MKLVSQFVARGGEGGWACLTFSNGEEEPRTVDIQITADHDNGDWLSTLILDLAALEQLGFYKVDNFQC